MRIGELSRRSGVPVPTIKYYLREGLLVHGEASGPNRVHYGESHLRRLRLVRSLLEVGRLSIAHARTVLRQVDEPDHSQFTRLGKVQYAINAVAPAATPLRDDERTDALLRRLGWRVSPNNPDRRNLADLLHRLQVEGCTDVLERLDEYAAAARTLAELDLDAVHAAGHSDAALEAVATITVLGDALVAALRHLAQEDVAASRQSGGPMNER